MYTLIPFQKIVESLSVCDQKLFNKDEYKYLNVCLEDLWNCLPDYEKREFLKEHASDIIDELTSYNLISTGLENVIQNEINSDPFGVLDQMDVDDIVEYLKDEGYEVL
jgi:hypothetical protein